MYDPFSLASLVPVVKAISANSQELFGTSNPVANNPFPQFLITVVPTVASILCLSANDFL